MQRPPLSLVQRAALGQWGRRAVGPLLPVPPLGPTPSDVRQAAFSHLGRTPAFWLCLAGKQDEVRRRRKCSGSLASSTYNIIQNGFLRVRTEWLREAPASRSAGAWRSRTVHSFGVFENAGSINDICLCLSSQRCLQTEGCRNESPAFVNIQASLSPSSAAVLSTAVCS